MKEEKMRVLITGIGGFIGSHACAHILLNTDWEIVGIDSWNHKGVSERLTDSIHYQAHRNRVRIYTHDLNAPISDILAKRIGQVDYIINFAAESHVDRSIKDPVNFIKNNVNSVLTMLEYARKVKPKAFVQISTDETYGAAEPGKDNVEWDPHIPSNPYAASKAAQEDIAIAYWRTYGVPVVITNTMNNFAEMQDTEKFIPKVMRKVMLGETVEIHSSPDLKTIGSRYWLHARNHIDAVLWLITNAKPAMYPDVDRPDRYNIVGEVEVDNLEMAQLIAQFMGEKLDYKLVNFHESRPGHDTRYGLSGKKLADMGYKFPVPFRESLEKTVKWTLNRKDTWL